MDINHITRHTRPNKYDTAPFGTICHSIADDEEDEYFVQLSRDENEAQWKPIGALLEAAFMECLKDEEFLKELLVLISPTDYKSFEKVAEYLKNKTILY